MSNVPQIDYHALARGMSIEVQHRNARRFNSRNRGAGRLLLLLLLALLFVAVVVWLTVVVHPVGASPALSATGPLNPPCEWVWSCK